MWKLLFIAALIAFPAKQTANRRSDIVVFWTGNKLNEQENSTVGFNQGMAMGYVTGVSDAISGAGFICPPVNVTINQTDAVVKKWLQDHPADWHLSAESLIRNALESAFPCK